ncbi:hypothetical protein GIB67_039830 [Kingdonia uniflora]|uniref:tRNA (guanine(9)-N(1))-methyltransferase n=1 Tax=Kingdonia uniflora TaxID=39325 RepID=A0A7J7P354_9MAGN|nr:hypothetical protein GIB67_039830 [Kingdonia uniflora]
MLSVSVGEENEVESRISPEDVLQYYGMENYSATGGPRSKVIRKDSLLDIVAQEGVELEIVPKKLGINKNKGANNRSKKVQKSQPKILIMGAEACKKRVADGGKHLFLSKATDLDFVDVPEETTSSKLALKFLKKKTGKCGSATGTTGSGEVEGDAKKMRVDPLAEVNGVKVVESQPIDEDELRAVEDRERLAARKGTEEMSASAQLELGKMELKDMHLRIEELDNELAKEKNASTSLLTSQTELQRRTGSLRNFAQLAKLRTASQAESNKAAKKVKKHNKIMLRVDRHMEWQDGRFLGMCLITRVADRVGVGVQFNPFVKWEDKIMFSYAVNGRCTLPAHLWLTGCKGEIQTQLQRLPRFYKWIIEKESDSYIEALQDEKERLVYLTAYSEIVLEELDLKSIYSIGGLVGHNRWKGITMKKAIDQGIKIVKFPIGSFMMMSSSQVLFPSFCFIMKLPL